MAQQKMVLVTHTLIFKQLRVKNYIIAFSKGDKMLNSKAALQGLLKAPPEKRYKSFLNTVADLEVVWFLSSEQGYATYDFDGFIHVLVWPRKEFCDFMMSEDEKPECMGIRDFLEKCRTLDEPIRFMVFPTQIDSYVVTVTQLCADIEAHLEEIE